MKNPRIHKLSLAFMSMFYILAGTSHFIITDFYLTVMPPYIPYHKLMVYASGLVEILLGFGLMSSKTRRLSAWGIIALLIAVFPANIHAYVNDIDVFGLPRWVILLRLPFQGVLIYWAYIYTRINLHGKTS